MKTVRLWGGAGDGAEVAISDEQAARRIGINWRDARIDQHASVWASTVGEHYEHSMVVGSFRHPCLKGLVMKVEWDFWCKDIQPCSGLVQVVTKAQRADRALLTIDADTCPWVSERG